MAEQLKGKRVAFVVTDGFEQVELTGPKERLEEMGATCQIVSPKEGKVKGWQHVKWGDELDVDVPLAQARPDDYDAVVLPGGQMNPDKLRNVPEVQRFVRAFREAGKPVAAICHGPWILIDSGLVDGVKMTSWPTVKTDLVNAGAEWVDEEVVVDDGIITSRKPEDVPAFASKIAEELLEPPHGEARERRAASQRTSA